MIPVVDLFAGPGGLCEGFSHEVSGEHPFKPVLSIEMDPVAHRTLQLRAFVHYFMRNRIEIPDAYYEYVRGNIDREILFGQYKDAADEAMRVAWCAELGGTRVPKAEFDKRIQGALQRGKDWLLIGGPPCQAYSLAGRSRSVGGIKNRENLSREEAEQEFNKDRRQRLYRQYLRIIAVHSPAIFVMENVAGMLSAKVDGEPVFPKIIKDLKEPGRVVNRYFPGSKGCNSEYHILSFVTGKEECADEGDKFLIRSELYGVPQCRHRVILLGIRDDIYKRGLKVGKLMPVDRMRTVLDAIGDLPNLTSTISKRINGTEEGGVVEFLDKFVDSKAYSTLDEATRVILTGAALRRKRKRDLHYIAPKDLMASHELLTWYSDVNIGEPLNHVSRAHMSGDLYRYLYVAAYGMAHGRSPVLADFPRELLPNHANVRLNGRNKSCDFADRFKVQLWNKPSSTVTSHIAKDGHYFIHPDAAQCRSLTVREAARLQTFPDNYFFEGNRTQQYHQVGNAVPPYLANQLAEIVYDIFRQHGKC